MDKLLDDLPPGPEWIPIPAAPGNRFQELVLRPWGKLDGDQPVLAFRVMPHHCNPRDVCHGGMLMAFVDFVLPAAARLQDGAADSFTPTISVTTNFLAPARLGAWIEGRMRVVRRDTDLLFVEGDLRTDAAFVVQMSGIFKYGGADGRRAGSAELLAKLRAAQQAAR